MTIYHSSLFERHFKKLSPPIQRKAALRDRLFRLNPFDSRLETHKLHGDKREEWAYSVDYSYRISFVFLKGGSVLYTDIGTHDELYR